MPFCGGKFKFIKIIDIFGKNVELYYKGKEKKTSYYGSLLTITYALIYIGFFLYKFVRMLQRKEITFYDTYAYVDKPPIINITNENFYGGFALENPETYDPFIDETIYYPKAYFKTARRDGDNWDWTIENIELEKCNIDKFGSFYREKFTSKALHNLYCFKNVDNTLVGHYSYDYYSFFYIEFFPCVNTTENNNHCKRLEEIDYYLKSTFISFQLQDIELNPLNYNNPVKPKNQDSYTTVGKSLYQEIHVFFQIVDIETDLDLFGFTEFEYVRSEKYLKYESAVQMTSLNEYNIYETGDSFCDITIKLSEKLLIEKRRYMKLIEVLRDVGGFTGVILSILQVFSSFPVYLLYEISLINSLFEFDINKKMVLIHNKYKNKLTDKKKTSSKDIKIYSMNNSNKKIQYSSIIANEENNSFSKNNLNLLSNDKNLVVKKIKSKKKRQKSIKNNNIFFHFNRNETFNRKKGIKIENNLMNNYILKENKSNKELYKENKYIIDKIKINKTYLFFCFLYVRKKRNRENILLDEGKKLIIEKLDILNIFRKLFCNDEILKNERNIKMSDTCINNLKYINKVHRAT